MLHTNKFLGSVLLVSGTSIGGGMLLIPVVSSFAGFIPSFFLLVFTWFYMFLTALLFLEVNLSIPGKINLISMVQATLGTKGKIVSWITYLLLLYSLLAAYIAGSQMLFYEAFLFMGITLPNWALPLPLLLLFGVFIYLGTRMTDYINRLFMIGLLFAYLLLAFFLPDHIQGKYLTHSDPKTVFLALPLIFTSFGFHIIIPSLTNYLNRDRKKLFLSLLIGSLITLSIYLFWQYMILGSIPLEGPSGLVATWIKGEPSTAPLLKIVQHPILSTASRCFAFFALITSFLGVSLSLASFLHDGLHIKKSSLGRLGSCFLTFIPPLLFVYFYKRGFMMALQYATIFVMILLAIIPALMTWTLQKKSFWKRPLGRLCLIFIILIALFVIAIDLYEEAGYLKHLVSHYLVVHYVSS